MKKIVLVRHAKSSWKFPELKDLDRPLKKRGLDDAPLMGKVLQEHEVKPDLIISSPAERALITAKIIANQIGYDEANIISNPHLYLESRSNLLKEIQALDDMHNTVFFIGHNPGVTNLANYLSSGKSIDNIPTCGAVAIQFEVESWKDIEKGEGKLLFFDIPKKVRKKIEKTEKQVL